MLKVFMNDGKPAGKQFQYDGLKICFPASEWAQAPDIFRSQTPYTGDPP
jgi:hypothetical protein